MLTQQELDEVMDPKKQEEEIKRIQGAANGLVLYTAFQADQEKINLYDSIMELSKCPYHHSLWLSRGRIQWIKGRYLLNYHD